MSGLSLVLLPSTVFDLVCNSLQSQRSFFGSYQTPVSRRDTPSQYCSARDAPEPDVRGGRRCADPQRDPPRGPPIIILSKNSRTGGSQPHRAQDQDPAFLPPATTSFPLQKDPSPSKGFISTAPKKPSPEPHPAPPVIILAARTRTRPAQASPPRSTTTPPPPPTRPARHGTMGSKASKIKPAHGKLQSSQEKRDKDEMKEPSNYYTHRSKSMRRKAGKEGSSDAAGGAVGGSAGAGVM